MAKGGRYLKQEEKKKKKGGKVLLIVLIILALLLCGVGYYVVTSYNDILEGLNFAVTEKKDVSEEDIQSILGNPQQ